VQNDRVRGSEALTCRAPSGQVQMNTGKQIWEFIRERKFTLRGKLPEFLSSLVWTYPDGARQRRIPPPRTLDTASCASVPRCVEFEKCSL